MSRRKIMFGAALMTFLLYVGLWIASSIWFYTLKHGGVRIYEFKLMEGMVSITDSPNLSPPFGWRFHIQTSDYYSFVPVLPFRGFEYFSNDFTDRSGLSVPLWPGGTLLAALTVMAWLRASGTRRPGFPVTRVD